jgi:Uma2 family endonuclease
MRELTESSACKIVYDLKSHDLAISQPRQAAFKQRFLVLREISWTTYVALMHDVGDGRGWRIAYEDEALELRMPHQEHEEPTAMLESFIDAFADDLEFEVRKLGALTLERDDLRKAVEPDACFYIQNELRIRGKNPKLPEDPPPDLVIESDHTHSSVNKHSIYAALGVPEIWRYRKNKLEVYQLVAGKYDRVNQSLAFPCLPIEELPELIQQSQVIGQRAAVRAFRQRIQAIVHNQSPP